MTTHDQPPRCGLPGSTEPMHGLGDVALALGGSEESFTGRLLLLIAKAQASPVNYQRLRAAFPIEVHAWELWMATSPPPTCDELLAALAGGTPTRMAPPTDDVYHVAAAAFCAGPGDSAANDWATHAPFRAAIDAALTYRDEART